MDISMKKLFFLLLLTFFSINTYSSEFLNEVKEDAISPVTTDAWKVLAIGAGLTAITYVFKDTFREDLQHDIGGRKPLGKYSKWGDFLGHSVPNIAYVLAMGGDYLFTHDQKALDRTVLMTKSTLYAGALTTIAKPIINERRPNGGKSSFPSGHATTAFAFSSVIAMEHSLPWGIAANAMAAFVGFSRINDNAHYLHDVIAGATVGTMYGVGVCLAARARESQSSGPGNASTFLLVPITGGLASNYSLSF
jgi:membrane-associated phospholipid phosphatase